MAVGVSQFDPTNPASVDDAVTLPLAANNAASTLSGALSADVYGNQGASQTILLADATLFPTAGWISVNAEIISYSGKTGNQLTGIVRGEQGTQIRSHIGRALVVLNMTAQHLNCLRLAIISLQTMFTKFKTEQGTTDGAPTLTLAFTPVTGPKVLLFINGTFFTEGVDFTRVATVLTWDPILWATPPPTGMTYTAIYYAQ